MDKKIYIQPQTEISKVVLTEMMLTGSVTAPGQGIGYGGVDEGGEKDPDVKGEAWTDIWD